MIKESAVKHKWIIYTWKRHCDCIIKAVEATWDKPITWEQWFMTIGWAFVSRETAASLALYCWQIKKLKYSVNKLYSEDLY